MVSFVGTEIENREMVCLGGDFNYVRSTQERSGNVKLEETNEFNDFIEIMEVIDVPIIGNSSTWTNMEDSSRSRLDMFLLTEGLIESRKVIG